MSLLLILLMCRGTDGTLDSVDGGRHQDDGTQLFGVSLGLGGGRGIMDVGSGVLVELGKRAWLGRWSRQWWGVGTCFRGTEVGTGPSRDELPGFHWLWKYVGSRSSGRGDRHGSLCYRGKRRGSWNRDGRQCWRVNSRRQRDRDAVRDTGTTGLDPFLVQFPQSSGPIDYVERMPVYELEVTPKKAVLGVEGLSRDASQPSPLLTELGLTIVKMRLTGIV